MLARKFTCSICGTETDKWFTANYGTGLCKCVDCEGKEFLPERLEKARLPKWQYLKSWERDVIANRWADTEDGRKYQRSKINPWLAICEHVKRRGFTVNQYRSGEVTGAQFQTGYESCFPPVRFGQLETEEMSSRGKTKIRRAIQCADVDFRCFMTVTFDPVLSELDEDGKVSQKWGKEKFKKFIHAIKVSCDRKAALSGDESKRIAYVWVAELQASGNIHFHVMLNHRLPIEWLTRLWNQAKNSIDVRPVQNKNHASCYLRKYISKGKSTIIGNRYAISQNLRETMKPMKKTTEDNEQVKAVKELIDAIKNDIESNGGKVIDCGFFIPPPSRSVVYEEGFKPGAPINRKRGKIRKTKAVSGHLGPFIMKEVVDIFDPIPF